MPTRLDQVFTHPGASLAVTAWGNLLPRCLGRGDPVPARICAEREVKQSAENEL